MRVATNMLPGMLVRQMHQLGDRQNRLQAQASSGQKIQWGDEDPAAMARALELRSTSVANTQYGRNIQALQDRLTSSLGSIRSLQKAVDRAGEIVANVDDLSSPEELKAYAAEIDQMLRQSVQTANAKHGQDYLFGGTRTDRPPFVLKEDANGRITGVDYQGNQDTAGIEIGEGTVVSDQIPGANPGAGAKAGLVSDSGSGADLFSHLIALRDRLEAGDTAGIAANDAAALEKDEANLVARMAESGALQARLEAARSGVTEQTSRLNQSMQDTTSADLPETLIQLNATKVAYQAALQSGAQLLRTSLMDYLR